jgi:hypothetical protein
MHVVVMARADICDRTRAATARAAPSAAWSDTMAQASRAVARTCAGATL